MALQLAKTAPTANRTRSASSSITNSMDRVAATKTWSTSRSTSSTSRRVATAAPKRNRNATTLQITQVLATKEAVVSPIPPADIKVIGQEAVRSTGSKMAASSTKVATTEDKEAEVADSTRRTSSSETL